MGLRLRRNVDTRPLSSGYSFRCVFLLVSPNSTVTTDGKHNMYHTLTADGCLNCSCRKSAQHQQTNNRITQPSGAATPRNSDTHKRIAVPKAFCVLREHTRPRPKSGKVCRSDTRPGDVCERAVRAEGSDSGPIRNARVSPCKPLCAIFLQKPSVYPISDVIANVRRL